MGVLDDAIREHLELKRQHGAPEAEVSSKEREALGAPRDERPDPSADAAESPTAEPAAEQPVREEVPQRLAKEPAAAQDERPAPAPEPRDEEPSAAQDERPAPAPEPRDEEPARPADQAPAPEPAPPRPDRGSQGADPEGDPEDVLEETPEFLQETPEHDRLWFEQKPPRDFDFDE